MSLISGQQRKDKDGLLRWKKIYDHWFEAMIRDKKQEEGEEEEEEEDKILLRSNLPP